MKPFQYLNREFALNEIVFENRNKAYGAYDLRNHAGHYMNKALFSGILFFGLITAGAFVYTNLTNSPVIEEGPRVQFNGVIINEPADPVKPPKADPVPIQPQQPVKTYNAQVPEPVNNPPVENVVSKPPVDAIAGTQNIEAPAATHPVIQAPVIQQPGTGNQPVVTQPPVVSNDPKIKVDVEASFNGGLESFRTKIRENFDGSAMDGTDGIVKAMVTFIVERDGTITNIKAEGANRTFNEEAVRTVKSVKGKWIPAKLDGQYVRSYFRIPISMKFEE